MRSYKYLDRCKQGHKTELESSLMEVTRESPSKQAWQAHGLLSGLLKRNQSLLILHPVDQILSIWELRCHCVV